MIRTYDGKRGLSAGLIAVLACFSLGCQPAAAEKIIFRSLVPTLEPLPAPRVLRGSVVEAVGAPVPAVNVFGYAERGSRYPTEVTYVAPDTVAWRGGLQKNDRILSARVKDGRADLIVMRAGKKYSCVLRLAAAAGTLDSGTAGDGALKGGASKNSPAQALVNYSIAMVVDNSASMGTRDCPGDISRWQWCKDHINELYSQENGVLQRNISIVTFDSNFHSRQNCSPSDLKSVFASAVPSGETYMAPALEEAFLLVRRQLNSGRPAIVSVISDGRPSDVENVKKAIIKETNILSNPKLLSIVFIEVGTPEHYLRELDNDLVKQGAAADIVKVVPFAEAQGQGLSKTLAATIPKPPSTTPGSGLTVSGGVSARDTGPNRAQAAISSHIFTFNPNAGTRHTLVTRPAPAVVPTPAARAVPQLIKPHPTGTPPVGAAVPVKPQEIDEKAAVLRGSADRTYK
ncbi:MAG: VWA domain-containing protein [Cyanobacteria bacterium SZAS LIN-2]|nr:VWA domain-containing protein [Cyanobacteria bacterium SZAS LIN-2]